MDGHREPNHLLQKPPQQARPRRVPQLSQALRLDVTDPVERPGLGMPAHRHLAPDRLFVLSLLVLDLLRRQALAEIFRQAVEEISVPALGLEIPLRRPQKPRPGVADSERTLSPQPTTRSAAWPKTVTP